MKLSRRKLLSLTGAMVGRPALAAPASADDYPSRPVHVLVGYPPGGPTDIIARLIAQRLEDRLRQKFVVENRPGADSNIATEACVRASADGYVLVMIWARTRIIWRFTII